MRRLLAMLLLLLPAAAATAAEAVAARLFTVPARPFVGQPFDLHLTVDTSPGAELQGMTLEGLPAAGQVVLESPVARPSTNAVVDGRTVTRHHYVSAGRGLTPFRQTLQVRLSATLVERRQVSFFSSWSASSIGLRLPAVELVIRPLPDAGRPADFDGAIGLFTLAGRVEPAIVAPNDLVTLSLELVGSGYLGQARITLPEQAGFRTYPPQETARDATSRISVRQVLMPLHTNATTIAAARFSYFDPVQEMYRTTVAGPFALRFGERQAEAMAYRHIAPVPAAPRAVPEMAVVAPDAIAAQVRRAAPAAVALLLGLIVGALLRPRHRGAAVAAALLMAAAAYAAGTWWQQHPGRPTAALKDATELRLAPGSMAAVLLALPAGTAATPLEQDGNWVRIQAAGRRGWIAAEALEESPPRRESAPSPAP